MPDIEPNAMIEPIRNSPGQNPPASSIEPSELLDMFEHTRAGMALYDAAGQLTYANPAARRMLGMAAPQAAAAAAFLAEDGRPLPPEQHPARLALTSGQPAGAILGVVLPGAGAPAWLRASATPQFAPGQAAACRAAVTYEDVTELVQAGQNTRNAAAQAAIHAAQKFHRLAFENSPNGLVVTDAQGKIKFGSQTIVPIMLGFQRDEQVSPAGSAALPPDEAALLTANFHAVLADPAVVKKAIHRFLHADGSTGWVEITLSNHLADPDINGIAISFRDITESQQANEALQRANERYQLIANHARDVIWVLDIETQRFTYVSPSIKKMRGYLPEEVMQQSFFDALTPESAEQVAKVLSDMIPRALAGHTIPTVTLELNEKHRNGSILYTEVSANFVFNNGKPQVIGISREISERRRNEQLVKKAQASLELAQQIAQMGSWEYDPSTGLTTWSKQMFALFQLDPAEGIPSAEELLAIIDPFDRNILLNLRQWVLEHGHPGSYIFHLQLPNGSERIYETNIYPVDEPETGRRTLSGTLFDITDRYHAQQQLHQAIERFEQLAGTIQDAFWITDNHNGQFIYMSPAFEKIFGIPPTSFAEVSAIFRQRIHPEDLPAFPRIHVDEMAGIPCELEFRFMLPDGSLRWIWERRFPVLDENSRYKHTIGISSDITTNKLAQLALEASEDKYRRLAEALEQRVKERTAQLQDLYDHAPNGYHSLDAGGVYQMVNQTELDWLGETREALIGKRKLTEFITPESREKFNIIFPLFMQRGWVKDEEMTLVRKDGTLMPFILNATAMYDADGHFVMSRAILVDNTERKKAEDALRSANAALAKASRLKDEFLASMSHELRTPLTGILGLAEALQLETYGSLSQRQIRALANIEGSGRHLLELINDVLDLSKIEAEKLDLEFEPCDVGAICQASLQLTKGMASKKNQRVSYTSSLISAVVRADPRRFKQMLVNLLSNAVKFTPEGGRLGLEVTGSADEQQLSLTVWDQGIGIRQEDLPRLFTPFTQLDSSLSRQQSGTGLGLSLVSRLAELHGGYVTVESTFGEGSRFTLTLPWQVENSPAGRAGAARISRFRRALVIEDNPLHSRQLCTYLARLNIASEVREQGEGALEAALEHQPEVILLDLHLPDLPGEDVLRALKADPRTHEIPVIITSVSDDRAQHLKIGAAECLVKPYLFDDLQKALEHAQSGVGHRPDAAAAGQSKARLLLVDDDPIILETITDFLKARGYEVIEAASGAEMLAKAPNVQADLILTDIQMPGMDGLQAIRWLRASGNPYLSRVPIVAITALAMPGDEQLCLDAGANRYISKPIPLARLIDLIEELLAGRED